MPHRKPVTLEMIEANKKIYDEYFEASRNADFVEQLMTPIDRLYFRSRFIGFDETPERNNPDHPLIYISNHSGMAFPWDAIVFVSMFFKRNKFDFSKSVRALTAPMLSKSTLMNPFLVENFWKRGGGIDASFLNFNTMMFYQHSNLLVYPEGVPGIGKPFSKRYQLQRFATSFVRMAIKYETDVIPFATVNGEYVNPYNLKSDFVNKIAQKLGIPFIPLGLMTLLIPLQPWMFYFGFPAKLTYVMGKRIKPYEMIDKPYEKITDEEFQQIADRIKAQLQTELNAAVEKYGKKPYQVKELFSRWRKNKRKFPYFIPSFWPSLFAEFDRLSRKGRVKEMKVDVFSGLRAFRRHPVNIAFFVPILGWIPILVKGYRKRSDSSHEAHKRYRKEKEV